MIFLVLQVLFLAVQSTMGVVGNGTLYAYIDSTYTTLVETGQPPGAFMVSQGQAVYIQIAGITEFTEGTVILVKISWDTHVKTWTRTVKTLDSGQTGSIGVGDSTNPIIWTVGEFDDGYFEIPPSNTLTVHYKDISGTGPEHVAAGTMMRTGHLHIIPETPLGTIGPLMILLTGLGVFILARKKTNTTKPVLCRG